MPLQIRDRIFRDILAGVWQESNLLPGAMALARRYNAGYCSTVEALRILSSEGIILRRSGRRSRIITEQRRSCQIGIIVDDALKDFPPFNYTYAATTFLKFNAVQLELFNAGHAGLSLPPDLDFSAYLPKLDGTIVLRDTDGQWRYSESANTPRTVYCFNQKPETVPEWYSYIGYESAFEKAATVLAARGVKNIVLLCHIERRERFAVLQQAVEKYPQISCTMRFCPRCMEVEDAQLLARELLNTVEPPCGFVVIGDLLGWCLCKEALQKKYNLKKDISIIGTSGLPESAVKHPALSVIEVPVKAQAAAAVRQLEAMLNDPVAGEVARCIKIDAKLILRDT